MDRDEEDEKKGDRGIGPQLQLQRWLGYYQRLREEMKVAGGWKLSILMEAMTMALWDSPGVESWRRSHFLEIFFEFLARANNLPRNDLQIGPSASN
jgi:hypothetical protein